MSTTALDKNLVSNPPGKGFRFIDLFAGIGGFHAAFAELGAECVFVSERDTEARKTYLHNFREHAPQVFPKGESEWPRFNRDITEITQPDGLTMPYGRATSGQREIITKNIINKIPPHDVLCAGFPCQPFSQAGYKRGFDDDRGNLFYDIEKILRAHGPQAIFLENVRHLLSHDGGRTMKVIGERLEAAGYRFTPYVVKASDHGVPQHRPRLFILGFLDHEVHERFSPPEKRELEVTLDQVMDGRVTMTRHGDAREIGFTLRVGGRNSPMDDRRNWDGYWVDGKETRITWRQGLKMQGFPEVFDFPEDVSLTHRMKQLGNSVAVPAIRDYAAAIFRAIGEGQS